MKPRYTLARANAMLPLIRAIAAELRDRRHEREDLLRCRAQLERAHTPEGLVDAVRELDARLYEQEAASRAALAEFGRLGIDVLRTEPLTLHIPGDARGGPLVFCWQDGEGEIRHGHRIGEEDDPRRPLRVRAIGEDSSSAA